MPPKAERGDAECMAGLRAAELLPVGATAITGTATSPPKPRNSVVGVTDNHSAIGIFRGFPLGKRTFQPSCVFLRSILTAYCLVKLARQSVERRMAMSYAVQVRWRMVLGATPEGQAMHLTLAAPPERERVGNLRLCQGYNNLLLLAFFEDCHIATFSRWQGWHGWQGWQG
jgi:hypothetical protein